MSTVFCCVLLNFVALRKTANYSGSPLFLGFAVLIFFPFLQSLEPYSLKILEAQLKLYLDDLLKDFQNIISRDFVKIG